MAFCTDPRSVFASARHLSVRENRLRNPAIARYSKVILARPRPFFLLFQDFPATFPRTYRPNGDRHDDWEPALPATDAGTKPASSRALLLTLEIDLCVL